MNIDDLYDGKIWVHGTNTENIQITIFLITINGEQLKYCLNAINNLDKTISVYVNVIMNIAPTSRAYNMMVERCTTKFFIQLDEDMELFSNSIKTISDNLKTITNKCYLHYYYLIDDYLGINNPPVIIGIKIYNNTIMKQYNVPKLGTNIVSCVDQFWQKQINSDGYTNKQFFTPIGYHARKRSNFDIMLRYCKMIKSMLDPRINSHRSDKMKILKPMNKIPAFNVLYKSIVGHFVSLGYDVNKFIKNNTIMIKFLSDVPVKNLKMYDIPNDFISVDPLNTYGTYDLELFKIPFGCNMSNVKNLYAIIGIVNSLFENYQYSFEHYPYDINVHFEKIFKFNILFIINTDTDKIIVMALFNNAEHIDMKHISIDFSNKLMCDIKHNLIVNTTSHDYDVTHCCYVKTIIENNTICNIGDIFDIIFNNDRT